MKETAEAPIPSWSSTYSPADILFAALLFPTSQLKKTTLDVNVGIMQLLQFHNRFASLERKKILPSYLLSPILEGRMLRSFRGVEAGILFDMI